ncbi:hypothetical protein J1605_009371 [Eschrichtius robustus]|uniref:Uncharacterized protein n=1 Tax=Eschrichtius robustus TaxID=9764 RepID=A0AB34GT82_ESCRO|nr:hypothetical protein J1605_009371 [Eschrichtius robustus]
MLISLTEIPKGRFHQAFQQCARGHQRRSEGPLAVCHCVLRPQAGVREQRRGQGVLGQKLDRGWRGRAEDEEGLRAGGGSLSEDPRKQPNKVSSYATLFAQALPRDAHSTPYYYARPQTLPLNYQDRSAAPAQSSGSLGSSGVGSGSACALCGPAPTPQPLLPG